MGRLDVPDHDASLRATLLHRPPPPPGAINRDSLLSSLDAGLAGPATLIAAPTGYGKTVLVSQWCERLAVPVVWVSLASSVDCLQAFLRHLAAGVRRAAQGEMAACQRLVETGDEPTETAAAMALSNDLVDLPGRIVIVLDDFHVIRSAAVHGVMWEMLRHPPAAVHMVIATRRDPPWPIGSLRASGTLHELRVDELRFGLVEMADFVGSHLGRELRVEEEAALEAATEGWAAGLRLAAHAMRHGATAESVCGATYLDRGAQEYLVAEVLDALPGHMLQLLVAVSYFERFSAAVCDAMIDRGDLDLDVTGPEFISWLMHEGLFLIPLDDEGAWYRFHPVFRRLLNVWRADHASRFGFQQNDLHRLAAHAYCQQGMTAEAVGELALAGDLEELVAMVLARGTEYVDAERWGDLSALLGAVPAELFDDEPALVVLRAWLVGEHGGRLSELDDLLGRASKLLDADPDQPLASRLRGQIAVLRGTYLHLCSGNFERAGTDAEAARRQLAPTPGRGLVEAYALSAMALAHSGRYSEARRLVDSLVGDRRFAHWPTDPMIRARPMLAWVAGDLDGVDRGGQELVAVGDRVGHRALLAAGHYFLGIGAYERNELARAEHHLSESIEVHDATVEVALHSSAALGLVQLASGRPQDASRTVTAAVVATHESRGDYHVPTAEAAMALVDLRCGRAATARRWARAAEFDVPQHRYMFFERVPVLIEVLLTSEPDAGRGRQLLAEALASAYGRFNRPVRTKLLGLAAIDAARCGATEAALVLLREAIVTAEEGGLVRSLADLGPELLPLLHRLDADGPELDHVAAVVAALDVGRLTPSEPGTVRAATGIPGDGGLTDREIDVLQLLAERYSNKEISRQLLIAPATVKKHTVTLYEKLHVHGRREAVAKARALGYLAT